MKKSLKILSLILAFVFAFPVCAFASAPDDTVLKFNKDGKFKIMLFADSQDDENLEETTTALMCEALDKYQPDFVIYLGDNTVADGYDNQFKAIQAVTAPVRDRDIPYGIVFGNHDQEFGVDKETLLEMYRSLGGCLTYDAVPGMYGCGSCNIPIMSSGGSGIAFNLWLIDSGSGNPDPGVGGYDYVHPDILEWYKNTSAKLAAENGGEPVPAMNFQHIVIPEIFDKLYVELPFDLGDASNHILGKNYSLIPVFTRLNGYWLEQCCPPSVYDGQLDAWKEAGDVIAAFHGHDHNNSYEVNIDGVDIVNVPTVGCNSYSKDVSRGAGLITLDENDPENYKYELINIYDLALEKDSSITKVNGGKSAAYYALVKFADTIVQCIFRVLHILKIDLL